MADLNFPLNPNVGDTYSIGSRTWIWNGTAWQLQSSIQNLDPFTVKTLIVTSATVSVSTNSGAAIIEGGVGIGGDLNVGGNINVQGTINAQIEGSITTATNLAGGDFYQIPYQTSVGQTAFSSDFKYNDTSKEFIVANANVFGNTSAGSGISTVTSVSIESANSIQLASSNLAQLNYNNTNFVQVDILGPTIVSGVHKVYLDSSGHLVIDAADETATNVGFGTLRVLNGGVYAGDNVYSVNNISGSTLTGRNLINGRIPYTTNSELTDSSVLLFDGSSVQIPALSVTSTSTFHDAVSIISTATSNTSTNGALTVYGGVGITENLNVGGNFHVWGPTTFSSPVTFSGTATYVFSTNTVYTDNILELHTTSTGVGGSWTFDDGKDIGFRFHYFNRTDNTDANAALVLANDTQWLEWYNKGAESNSGTFAGSSYGGFKTGQIWIADTINATSSTQSGALQVDGGAGIVNDLWVGGNIYQGGKLIVTQNELSTATVTSISAGPGISVTTSSGAVVVSNTGTLQLVTSNGATTDNAIAITNTSSSALSVTGSIVVGGDIVADGNVFAPASFVDVSATAGPNTTSNWWIKVLSFTLPNIGDSTTFKLRTNPKVLGSTVYSDNSDNDYMYFTYSKTGASTILGSAYLGIENTQPANSFSTVNHNLTYNSTSGQFELWRRSTIVGGRMYARIEEQLPAGPQSIVPVLSTTSTWVSAPPSLGAAATISLTNPGTFGVLQASALTLASGAVGLTVNGLANIGLSTGSGMTVQIAYGASSVNSTKTVNIGTGGLVGSISTVTIGSTVAGALDRLVVNSSVTQFNSTLQSISTSTGALQIRGGVGIGGNLYANTVYSRDKEVITSVDVVSGTGINISSVSTNSGAVIATVSNEGVLALTAGTDTAISSSTGNITVWNDSTLQSVTNRGSITSNRITISNDTSATSTGTGALIVAGGASIGGNLYVGGTFYAGGEAVLTTASFANSISGGSDIAITENSSGTVIVSSTSTLQSVTNRGSTTTNSISITNTAASNSISTGALTVAGGVGIGRNLYVGGTTNLVPGNVSANAWTTNGIGLIQSAGTWTDLTSTGTVANVYMNYFAPQTMSAANTTAVNNLYGTYFSNPVNGTNVTSVQRFALGAENTLINGTLQVSSTVVMNGAYVTVGNAATTGVINVATGATVSGNTKTVNIGTGGTTGSTTVVNIGTNTVGSTSTVNIYGGLYVPTTINNQAVFTIGDGGFGITGSTTTSKVFLISRDSNTTDGFLQLYSGSTLRTKISASGTSYLLSSNFAIGTTTATSLLHVNGTALVAGVTTITNATVATSTSTGALVVSGGVGIGGALYAGKGINVAGTSTFVDTLITGTITLAKTVVDTTATAVDTSLVTLDTFSVTAYRSAKYFISISNTGLGQYQTSEIWLVQDGTSAHIEQTSVMSMGSTPLVTFAVSVNAGTVSLQAVGDTAGNSIKVQSTYITI